MPYIELIGAPGSGKTTLARIWISANNGSQAGRQSLAALNSEREKAKLSRFGLPRMKLGIAFMHGLYFLGDITVALRFGFKCKGSIGRKASRYFSMLNYLLKARVLSKDAGWWIVDQGWLQLLLSCYAVKEIGRDTLLEWISRLNSSGYSPRELFVVQAPMEVIRDRIDRSAKHLRQRRHLTTEEYVLAHIEAVESVKDILNSANIRYRKGEELMEGAEKHAE